MICSSFTSLKLISAVYLLLVLSSCGYDDRENALLNNSINPKLDDKAIVFYTTGMVSVFSYNVSILSRDSELSNNCRANVFSYTWSDTIKHDKDTLVEIIWEEPETLVIYHPEKGTFWKKESKLNYNGTEYSIEYKIK